MSLSVSRITIRNIMGIENLEISPGKVTTIQGRNAQGKTSVLEAVKAGFGGADATLLRAGSPDGEAVILLSDGVSIRRRFTENGRPTATVKGPDGKKIDTPPQEYLDSLADVFSLNPLEFVKASKKERVEAFLSALDLKVPADRIAEILGHAPAPEAIKANAFDTIAHIRKAIYDSRTITNRLAKEKRAHALELTRGLPALSEDDVTKELAGTERAIEHLQGVKDKRSGEVTAETQRKMAITRSTLDEEIARLRKEAEEVMDGLRAAERQALQEIAQSSEEAIATHKERLGSLRARHESRIKAGETKQYIAKAEEEAGRQEVQSSDFTRIINDLDELNVKLLSRLPISGVELKDGDIFYDGVPFDRVNTQMQYRIGLEVANLRKKLINTVCVDGLEALDSENFEEFKQAAEGYDLQLILTRVSDTPLQIRTE